MQPIVAQMIDVDIGACGIALDFRLEPAPIARSARSSVSA